MPASVRRFRFVAVAEAVTFLALLVATYVKYAEDEPVGVQVLGPVHGLLFVVYVVMALGLRPQVGWTTRTTAIVLAGAVLPFGGFAVDRWLARRPQAPTA